MNNVIDIQIACNNEYLPSADDFQLWVDTAIASTKDVFELTIRIVNAEESQQLNNAYRHKNSPTNVLSFPFDVPDGIELNLLGDIVICADVVEQEAREQHKALQAHWAHMTIHGCLHLLGYDHINDDDAEEMEALEINKLASLGFNNPYINTELGN